MSKNLPKRKLNRLKNFDYSQNGFYFVTICTKYHTKFFGEILNKKMKLNKYGNIVKNIWLGTPKHINNIILDEYIIMPNHIHGIIKINNQEKNKNYNEDRSKMLLSKAIHGFKAAVTRKINQSNDIEFKWKRSYHDRIIRNDQELLIVQRYIQNNPAKWEISKHKV